MDELSTRSSHFCSEPVDTILERLEALVAVWMVNPVVHAVAGDDELRFKAKEDAVESFVKVGARETSASVAGFC